MWFLLCRWVPVGMAGLISCFLACLSFSFCVGSVGQWKWYLSTFGVHYHLQAQLKYPFRYPLVADQLHILCISHLSVAKG